MNEGKIICSDVTSLGKPSLTTQAKDSSLSFSFFIYIIFLYYIIIM